MSERLFVSSVQKELAEERLAVRDYVRGDPLLRRFFDVFLFEDLPASDRRADAVYLDEVDRCGLYVGLFGNEYGDVVGNAKSPTELEFDRATARSKPRLIFVKGTDDKGRDPRMAGRSCRRRTLPKPNGRHAQGKRRRQANTLQKRPT